MSDIFYSIFFYFWFIQHKGFFQLSSKDKKSCMIWCGCSWYLLDMDISLSVRLGITCWFSTILCDLDRFFFSLRKKKYAYTAYLLFNASNRRGMYWRRKDKKNKWGRVSNSAPNYIKNRPKKKKTIRRITIQRSWPPNCRFLFFLLLLSSLSWFMAVKQIQRAVFYNLWSHRNDNEAILQLRVLHTNLK